MAKSKQVTNEELAADMKRLMEAMEDLVGAAADSADTRIAAVRAKAEATLAQVRANAEAAKQAIVEKTEEITQRTDEYVHENPWSSVGLAAGMGLVVGLLLSSRR
jgi:ElaB/YqjD/DUF883 family membrane-anchored ribosome-binding protein